jgi:hypothetical protein
MEPRARASFEGMWFVYCWELVRKHETAKLEVSMGDTDSFIGALGLNKDEKKPMKETEMLVVFRRPGATFWYEWMPLP